MPFKKFLSRIGLSSRWSQEVGLALVTLAFGFGLMPWVIFMAGAAALGRYDGASVGRAYESVFQSLTTGSSASWIVVLGPFALLLLVRGLAYWWRASARLA